ncbi:MAG: 2-deoxy-D-gluconate 3-dehydrogenase [Deltaproteobacteria bacterium]|nr:MAG: 2-deoxy-D-gluconate 3-dehydrogenase [Deltaproteobacteria bacterium]
MILEKFRLDNQVAVVTGGTKGIGKAIAIALAEAGADIAVVSRKPSPEVEEYITKLGRRFIHHAADLTRRTETKKVIPSVVKNMGDVNILVNNAGICPRAPAEEYPEEYWDATLEIDLSAVFILSQAAGRIMLKKGKGKIINIASVLSFQGGLNIPAYSSAKHAVAGLTKALANSWAGKGVNVNAIAPGYFDTELTEDLKKDPERSKSLLSRVPAGRWGDPEDIAGAAVFLASPASDFLHGAILAVDGGWLAW